MNMAEYGSWRPQQPANVNFEPIIRGLKNDIFDRDCFIICKIQLQKKKSGVKNVWKLCPLRGGPTPNGKIHLKFSF